jgi:uncharacterized membrane protein YozB (DUF420 family)
MFVETPVSRERQIVFAMFPITGFLGTGATFAADLNLAVQVAMGCALIAGALLARRKRFTAHGVCQSTVLVLNLFMIGFVMWPSFRLQVIPALPRRLYRLYYGVAAVHGFAGVSAELLGLYILLVAGTKVLPPWLCFQNWKSWMRVELTLWMVVLLSGIETYYTWYIATFR